MVYLISFSLSLSLSQAIWYGEVHSTTKSTLFCSSLILIPFIISQSDSQDNKRKSVSAALGGDEDAEVGDRQREEEEKRIKALMKGMATAGVDDVSV